MTAARTTAKHRDTPLLNAALVPEEVGDTVWDAEGAPASPTVSCTLYTIVLGQTPDTTHAQNVTDPEAGGVQENEREVFGDTFTCV